MKTRYFYTKDDISEHIWIIKKQKDQSKVHIHYLSYSGSMWNQKWFNTNYTIKDIKKLSDYREIQESEIALLI